MTNEVVKKQYKKTQREGKGLENIKKGFVKSEQASLLIPRSEEENMRGAGGRQITCHSQNN
jgi:hypothetical protein